MARVLLDNSTPRKLGRLLGHHTVRATSDEGWSTLVNGVLLDAAEKAGYDVMVTADQNIPAQQRMAGRRLALVILSTNSWPVIGANPAPAIAAVDAATPGSVQLVTFPRPPLRRRPAPQP